MKPIRKAVRTFLVRDNKILTIKYKTELKKDYYDIPGGKIEENETPEEASIREFKEETGINIISQEYKGNAIVEFPDRIYDFDVFLVHDFKGQPLDFEENSSLWVDIDKLLQEEKTFASIEIIKYLQDPNIKLKIFSDEDNKIIKVINDSLK